MDQQVHVPVVALINGAGGAQLLRQVLHQGGCFCQKGGGVHRCRIGECVPGAQTVAVFALVELKKLQIHDQEMGGRHMDFRICVLKANEGMAAMLTGVAYVQGLGVLPQQARK